MSGKILWKFLGAFIFISLIAVFLLDFIVTLKLQDHFEDRIVDELRNNAMMVAEIIHDDLQSDHLSDIRRQVADLAGKLDMRITVVDRQGNVLGDSAEDYAKMENHAGRFEIAEAMDSGFGQSTRPSETLGYPMKYVAVRVDGADDPLGVVRFALPLSQLRLEKQLVYRIILVSAAISILISFGVAYWVSRSITSPIRRIQRAAEQIACGQFGATVRVSSRDELGQLARSLNAMSCELQRKVENLNRMHRLRTDFLASVSHELKTPLTLIRGYIETLEGRAIEDRDKARRFVSIIKNHADRLSNIVDDLLQLSELELSESGIRKVPCDLRDAINEVTLGFGHALEQKKHDLKVRAEGSDFKISGDPGKIEQLLVNLIDNAIKYTEPGGAIEIRLTEGDERTTIRVRDNGIGISPAHIDRVFERFYRVDKARSRELGGTGLGLGIAKHIVLAHGGEIRIDSTPGHGTEVVVVLPKS